VNLLVNLLVRVLALAHLNKEIDMHESSFTAIEDFRDRRLKVNDNLKIVDLFGLSRGDKPCGHLFQEDSWEYKAVSVKKDGWDKKLKADVVISGQTVERSERFWDLMEKVGKIINDGGYLCMIVASSGAYGHDGDHYRFNPDSMSILAGMAGMDIIECIPDRSTTWWNVVLIAKKPEYEATPEVIEGE